MAGEDAFLDFMNVADDIETEGVGGVSLGDRLRFHESMVERRWHRDANEKEEKEEFPEPDDASPMHIGSTQRERRW